MGRKKSYMGPLKKNDLTSYDLTTRGYPEVSVVAESKSVVRSLNFENMTCDLISVILKTYNKKLL